MHNIVLSLQHFCSRSSHYLAVGFEAWKPSRYLLPAIELYGKKGVSTPGPESTTNNNSRSGRIASASAANTTSRHSVGRVGGVLGAAAASSYAPPSCSSSIEEGHPQLVASGSGGSCTAATREDPGLVRVSWKEDGAADQFLR